MSKTKRIPYLSDAWLEAAHAAVATLPPADVESTVGFVVTGTDDDRRYSVRLGRDRISIRAGVADASVVLTTTRSVAVSIATGAQSAQRAFLDGQLRIGGDIGVLLRHGGALAEIEDRLAELRAATEF